MKKKKKNQIATVSVGSSIVAVGLGEKIVSNNTSLV